MELRDTRILVTGGAGFLGQHVVQALAARGGPQIVVREGLRRTIGWYQRSKAR
jgi:nucleoside-diphosphate-sugar epimerase